MKMNFIIDSNILFSAFISGGDVYRLLFSEYTIYLPDYAFLEIEKYKERILVKTKLTERQFKEFVITLLQNVVVIPSLLISKTSLKEAYQLCQSIDEKDTLYVATAIEFGFPLITNDKKLYTSLKEHGFAEVILLEDIIKHFQLKNDIQPNLTEN